MHLRLYRSSFICVNSERPIDKKLAMTNVITTPFKRLVTVPDGPRTCGDIIAWWEMRRIPYNIIVGLIGFASLMLFFFFITNCDVLEGGEDAVEPMALFAAPILINIAYTAGSVVEITLKLISREDSRLVGPVLFMLGLGFTVLAVLFPSALWGAIWVIRCM